MKPGKSKPPVTTIVLYAGAIVLALIAIGNLVNDIILFNGLVSQYVSQGYTTADVNKQLIPSQLIPVIFQAIINLGIALILWGAGLINQKLGTLLKKENLSE